jgi:hypothetical protein
MRCLVVVAVDDGDEKSKGGVRMRDLPLLLIVAVGEETTVGVGDNIVAGGE